MTKVGPKLVALVLVKADLLTLARSVSDGVISSADADSQRAELCTRLGPELVRSLDEYFEREVTRLKTHTGTRNARGK